MQILGVWLSLGHGLSMCVVPSGYAGIHLWFTPVLVWNLNMAQIHEKMWSNWLWAEGLNAIWGLGIKCDSVYGCTCILFPPIEWELFSWRYLEGSWGEGTLLESREQKREKRRHPALSIVCNHYKGRSFRISRASLKIHCSLLNKKSQ